MGVVTESWTPWCGGVWFVASYTWEQKVRAVERYLSCGGRALDVIRELGYPGCAGSLLRWVRAMAPGGRELGIELALRRGALELAGKGRGADPENLTRREKAILVRGTSEAFGLPVAVLLARVGLARSTYFHQLRAMARPDRDEGLLALVREAFENSGRRYGYRRVWLELRGAGIVVSAKRVMRLMTRHGLVPRSNGRAATARTGARSAAGRPRTWWGGTSTPRRRTACGSWTSPSSPSRRARRTCRR